MAPDHDGPFVRDTKRDLPSGEDLAIEDERFVVPPKMRKAGSYVSSSGEDVFFVVRPVAPGRRHVSLERRKRFFGSRRNERTAK